MSSGYGKSSLGFFVDTNVFGRQLGEGSLRHLKNLVSVGGEVYVPDVVCHELASHDFKELDRAVGRLNNLNVTPKRAFSREKLEKAIQKLITDAGAKISETPRDYYVQGVYAQIYSVSPAEAKINPEKPSSRVTTGAVDYIIYLHAQEHAKSGGTPCVITSDNVLKAAVAEIGGALTASNFDEAIKLVDSKAVEKNDLLNLIDFVMSSEFISGLKSYYSNQQFFKVAGIPQAVQGEDGKLTATVAVNSFITSAGGEFVERAFPEGVVVCSIDFDLKNLDFKVVGQTGQAPFIRWNLESTQEIDDFISFEIYMIPFVFRPERCSSRVEDMPEWNYVFEGKTVVFSHYLDEIAVVTWSDETAVVHGLIDDEPIEFDVEQIKISVSTRKGIESEPYKGVIFRAVVDYLRTSQLDQGGADTTI